MVLRMRRSNSVLAAPRPPDSSRPNWLQGFIHPFLLAVQQQICLPLLNFSDTPVHDIVGLLVPTVVLQDNK